MLELIVFKDKLRSIGDIERAIVEYGSDGSERLLLFTEYAIKPDLYNPIIFEERLQGLSRKGVKQGTYVFIPLTTAHIIGYLAYYWDPFSDLPNPDRAKNRLRMCGIKRYPKILGLTCPFGQLWQTDFSAETDLVKQSVSYPSVKVGDKLIEYRVCLDLVTGSTNSPDLILASGIELNLGNNVKVTDIAPVILNDSEKEGILVYENGKPLRGNEAMQRAQDLGLNVTIAPEIKQKRFWFF